MRCSLDGAHDGLHLARTDAGVNVQWSEFGDATYVVGRIDSPAQSESKQDTNTAGDGPLK